ncbi:MAG TPA: tetratricopeptide repeat protein [Vicinamibacterales bacterium]|nr:tetratricopeptide repeat protein [Vicinamibacterales bacterium]
MAIGVCVVADAARAQSGAGEEVARRQLDSGRSFARQGNYVEALKDFRAVAETHAQTSVADDAWLELARYYFDVARDDSQSQTAVDAILSNYATSDSAPAAYVIAGRMALGRSRSAADLDAALANFDRVSRLFPNSEMVPRALQLAGETLFYAGRLDEAQARLGRVTADYASDPAAADAYLVSGQVLAAMGDPILAMEELQQVRNRFPDTPAAETALNRLTLLHRLYVRAAKGPAYTAADAVGPARLENVVGLTLTGDNRLVWATETGVGVALPAGAPAISFAGKPRGLTLDSRGRVVPFDNMAVRPESGSSMQFAAAPEPNGIPKLFEHLVAVASLSTGEWLVMDEDQRAIMRFGRDASFVGPFAANRVLRLAVSSHDQVAAIDRDGRGISIYDAKGAVLAQIPSRTTAYDLRDAEDVRFDDFGHVYVLGRDKLAVFTPFGTQAPAGKPSYRLLTLFATPQGQTNVLSRGAALAVDSAGTVYVYDERSRRIQVFR